MRTHSEEHHLKPKILLCTVMTVWKKKISLNFYTHHLTCATTRTFSQLQDNTTYTNNQKQTQVSSNCQGPKRLNPVYTIRLVVYDSYSGVCDRMNTPKEIQPSTKCRGIVASAIIFIRENDNPIRLIVLSGLALKYSKLTYHQKFLYKTRKIIYNI